MKHVVIVALAFGCSQQQPACDARTTDALASAYTLSAAKLIDSGACDQFARVEHCPAYRVLEEHQDLALRGLGCR